MSIRTGQIDRTESAYYELDDVSRQKAEELSDRIDLTSFEYIASFGSNSSRRAADIASKTLDSVIHDPAGQIGDTLVQLVLAVDSLEGGSDHGGYLDGFLTKMNLKRTPPAVSLQKEKDMISYIERELERHKLSLNKDIILLNELYSENIDVYNCLNICIAAGELALNRFSGGNMEYIDRFEDRLNDLRISCSVCLQSTAQIKMIRESDEALLLKLQSSIVNTIPLWKQKLSLNAAVENTVKAAKATGLLESFTSKLRRNNAAALPAAAADPETMAAVNKDLTAAVLEYIMSEKKNAESRSGAAETLSGLPRLTN